MIPEFCHNCRLIEAVRDGIVVLDEVGTVVLWNGGAMELTGLAAEQVQGRKLYELELHLVDKNSIPIRERTFLALSALGKESILGIKRPDGVIIWVTIDIRPIEISDQLAGVIVTLHDITELKRTDQALRESEEKFREITDSLSAAFGIVCGTRFVYANRYFELLSGYTAEELLTKDFPDLVHPDFRELMITRALLRQRGDPVPNRYEFRMLTKSGEPRWVDFSVARTSFKGQPALIGTGFDITARKNAEATVRESEAKLKAFTENAPVLMGVVDLLPDDSDTIHLYDNPASCQYLNFPAGATVNRRASELGIPKEAVRFWVDRYRESERTKSPVHFECQDFRPQSQLWAEASVVFIGPAPNGCSRFIYMAQDITKRKRDEQALKEAKAAAERANATKDQFLAVLSHELRTPLTPVLGGVSLMEKRRDLGPEFREMFQMIRRNVTIEARLIDDLLDITRIAKGKVTIVHRAVSVNDAIKRAAQICVADIEGHHLHLKFSLPDPPLFISGDAERLQQVFWNLISNAVKFTPEGGAISVQEYLSDGKVVVEVQDTGVGIEPKNLERIFKEFEQIQPSDAARSAGLGLGLAISKRFIELHGGTISAHSEGIGKGALFRVALPALQQTQQPEKPSITEKSAVDRSKSVLLVEDHVDTAAMMSEILRSVGYQVETASDVAHALQAFARKTFDVLISDLGLPDRSGLELMQEVLGKYTAVKGIALSGFGTEDDVRKSKEAGFIEHVTKPVDCDVLLDIVDRVS